MDFRINKGQKPLLQEGLSRNMGIKGGSPEVRNL
jgi:hypothetical protein